MSARKAETPAAAELRAAQDAETRAAATLETARAATTTARDYLAGLTAMESPTAESLVDEEGTRRRLARLEAAEGAASRIAQKATERRAGAERAVETERVALLTAELDADGAKLEAEAVAFDAAFRERLATLRERAMVLLRDGHAYESPMIRLPAREANHPESALSACVYRARSVGLATWVKETPQE